MQPCNPPTKTDLRTAHYKLSMNQPNKQTKQATFPLAYLFCKPNQPYSTASCLYLAPIFSGRGQREPSRAGHWILWRREIWSNCTPQLAAAAAAAAAQREAVVGRPSDADLLSNGTSVTEARHLASAQGSADVDAAAACMHACKDGFPGRSAANGRPILSMFS